MNYKKSLLIFGVSSWAALGFYRGTVDYEYNRLYNEPAMYTNMVVRGLHGSMLYLFPVTISIMMYKELYRLEINLRNIASEKYGDFYNKLI